MEKIVLIGSSIAHSLSPRLHNHLFDLYRLPYRYELMPMATEEVVPAVEMMKRGGYRGANITSPHKLAALPALDALSPEAEAIGAVNTIVIERGRAVGYNTDAAGFIAPLREHPLLSASFNAAVLGTGGAAMAAAFALLAQPALTRLTLYSRDAGRALEVAESWGDERIVGRSYDVFEPADLLVNATPRSLAESHELPVPAHALGGTALMYEMIYWPPVTPLISAAYALGIETISGGPMFVAQALASFHLWTGVEAAEADVPEKLFE